MKTNEFKLELRSRVATMLIYGEIGSWGDVDARSVVNKIDGADVDEFIVRINSPGGSAFDGIAIYNALKRHTAKVAVTVDGQAGSAASIIAMAGDTIHMPTGSYIWIHNAWMYAEGEAGELRKQADMLDALNSEIAAIYVERTGLAPERVRQLMDETTWMNPQQAIGMGFATSIESRAVAAYNHKNHCVFAGVPVDASRVPPEVRSQLKEKPVELSDIPAELIEKIRAQGAEDERKRLEEIENCSLPGFEDLVAQAKADPRMSGRDLSYQILQRQRKSGETFQAARKADAEELNIGPGITEPANAARDRASEIEEARALLRKVRGGK